MHLRKMVAMPALAVLLAVPATAWAAEGGVSDAITGLTWLGAVTVGPDGNLYVTEITAGIDTSKAEPEPLPGRILRLLPDGTKQVVADGLTFPMGTAFDREGNLYAAVNAVSPTDGQILRFDHVASPVTGASDAGAPTCSPARAKARCRATPAERTTSIKSPNPRRALR